MSDPVESRPRTLTFKEKLDFFQKTTPQQIPSKANNGGRGQLSESARCKSLPRAAGSGFSKRNGHGEAQIKRPRSMAFNAPALKEEVPDSPTASKDSSDASLEIFPDHFEDELKVSTNGSNSHESPVTNGDQSQLLTLECQLRDVNKERDRLARQIEHLQLTKRNSVQDFQTKLDVTVEHVSVLVGTVENQSREVNDLHDEIEKLGNEVEASKLQAQTYEEDFNEERSARERAVGEKHILERRIQELTNRDALNLEIQELNDELTKARQAADIGKREKRVVIAKLELSIAQVQQLEQDSHTLKQKYDQSVAENVKFKAKADHFESRSRGLELQLEQIRAEFQQNQTELETTVELMSQDNGTLTEDCKKYKKQADQLGEEMKDYKQKQMDGIQLQRVLGQLDRQLKQTTAKLQASKQQSTPQYNESDLLQYQIMPSQQLRFDQPLASGCFGAVYAVEVNGKQYIAKRLLDILLARNNTEPMSDQQKNGFHQKFVQECILLSQIRHSNVVSFKGVCYGSDQYDLTLLMERLSTDLQAYLCRTPDVALSTKVSVLYDVSCGLVYLHKFQIVHRDLSAANVLLTADMQAKIADLGMSRVIDFNIVKLTTAPGALAYMPPEALKDRSVYDQSLDIFSMGVLALYLAIQEFPGFSWDEVPSEEKRLGKGEVYKRRVWIDKMDTRQPELSPLVLWCLCDDPVNRPSSVCLNILLGEISRDYQ